MGNPTQTQTWKKLSGMSFQRKLESHEIPDQVQDDGLGLSLDISKSFISNDIWAELFNLAREQNVEQWRDKMVAGEPINHTENRAVGHIWLRGGERDDVQNVLNQMKSFVEKTHSSQKFTDIVHIGIGGSDLGPRLICDALKHLPQKMNVHFVANVDAADITEILKPLTPAKTLFVIASKTFTTIETMMNATYAKTWLEDLPVADHMIALSTNRQAVAEFGIDTDNMFPFWDWVGGRFSMWSSIGMPIALTYGFDVFQDFLNGAKVMDNHFISTDLEQNLPVLLALFGVWNRNFMKRPALAVLPYAQNLSLLSNFLQQLDMESNGKSVDRQGEFITDYETGPIVFGQAGTNGQHAFHQWLHQGTNIVPSEFITIKNSPYDDKHHDILNKNAKAQAQAFADGFESLNDKHRHYNGNRPSVTLNLKDISPSTIGQLIALYEHKIFVQGIIWNINSFDQFGVELGKTLANQL
jgi:glucose-6-phosphate isomerase